MFVRNHKISDPEVRRSLGIVDQILDGALYYYTGSAVVSTSQDGLGIFRIPYYVEPGVLTRKNAWQHGDLLVSIVTYSSLGVNEDIDATLSAGVSDSAATVLDARTITIPASGGEFHEEFYVLPGIDLGPYDILMIELEPVGSFPESLVGLSILWRPMVA